MKRSKLGWVGLGCGISVTVICLVSGIFATIYGGEWQAYMQSRDWQTTSGSILSSSVESSTDSDGSLAYRARVIYAYYAGEHRYQAERVYFGDAAYSRDQNRARATVDKYPSETHINVRYNPDDPSDAVIERRLGSAFNTYFDVMKFLVLMSGLILGALIIKRG